MEELFESKQDVDNFISFGGSIDDLIFFSESITDKNIIKYIKELIKWHKKKKKQ